MVVGEIVKHVMFELQDDFSTEQLNRIKNTIIICFQGVKIEKECTEITIDHDANEKRLREFFISRKMENIADSSLQQYIRATKNFLTTVDKMYRDVTSDDIQYYLVNKMVRDKIAPSYADHLMKCFNSFFRWLCKKRYIDRNPIDELDSIRVPEKEIITLSSHEIVIIRDSFEGVLEEAIFDLLLSTGMRIGELVALNIDDIDFMSDEVRIYGQKSRRWRKGYLTAQAKKHLLDYLNTRDDNNPALLVSPNKPESRIQKGAVGKILRNLAQRSQINKRVTVHVIRKTFASIMFFKGADLKRVSELLGHKDIRTTERCYLNVFDEDMKSMHIKYAN